MKTFLVKGGDWFPFFLEERACNLFSSLIKLRSDLPEASRLKLRGSMLE